ncbi:predicted protein [Sclerotinia sclerotiorum 1980 UF-70]|uniref:Secreted protein n=2 Tax=Sclerotinia sclerotiorum (strain ATCC 18683 / 1980 / Ss-1) TaxID=665079 RepID=A7EQT1_SCLS1|nr:predicted protein [Sclerotinia sclerotiorum 1980 UF-70]APA13655.1 hypothetical protein sscle_11g084250 [Sclerotinia sclerotiorum 1980 UF-70]EDN91823.1 predicted protein [Sclerotinia sclerotiorum 1980 UF-70]
MHFTKTFSAPALFLVSASPAQFSDISTAPVNTFVRLLPLFSWALQPINFIQPHSAPLTSSSSLF